MRAVVCGLIATLFPLGVRRARAANGDGAALLKTGAAKMCDVSAALKETADTLTQRCSARKAVEEGLREKVHALLHAVGERGGNETLQDVASALRGFLRAEERQATLLAQEAAAAHSASLAADCIDTEMRDLALHSNGAGTTQNTGTACPLTGNEDAQTTHIGWDKETKQFKHTGGTGTKVDELDGCRPWSQDSKQDITAPLAKGGLGAAQKKD
ncbi:hypothetical protein ERJ75_000795000 [Trypanosoma vivax]|nr:hypothetical protein ERJ75_000795000 [Trypanosoma vivax]